MIRPQLPDVADTFLVQRLSKAPPKTSWGRERLQFQQTAETLRHDERLWGPRGGHPEELHSWPNR